jgi:cytoskeletal protein CcmA (bactofilin family)
MFTKKPETGESVTKMGSERLSESKTPFAERSAAFPAKSPSPSAKAASRVAPSIIGEDLTINGNVASKGEIQVDGEIQGDIHCNSLLLGDKSQVTGGVTADDVVVRGKVLGSIRGLRVTLQAQAHVEGDIYHQSLAIEQGAYFEGKSRRSDDPLADAKPSGAGSPQPGATAEKVSGPDSKPHAEANPIAPRAAE